MKLDEIKFEIIDVLHFMCNLNMTLGMDKENLSLLPIRRRTNVQMNPSCVTDLVKDILENFHYNLSQIVGNGKNVWFTAAWDNMRELFGMFCMSPEDVYNYYCSKNEENFARQERGY